MTRGIDNSEMIDRFLRDEMRGEERDVFLRRMETDPAFRLEVESQKLLAEAIRIARKNELKRYIADHTQTRMIRLRPAMVWSLSAAASVAAFAVFWFAWQHYDGTKEQLAKQQTQQESPLSAPEMPEAEANKSDRAIAGNTPAPAPSEAPVLVPEIATNTIEDVASQEEADDLTGTSSAPSIAEAETASYVVATITVAVADFNTAYKDESEKENLSRQDVVVVTSKRKPAGKEPAKVVTAKPSGNQTAGEQDDATDRQPVAVSRNLDQIGYTLVFINSREEIKKALPEKGNRIQLFNLPYNNPMLITLGGKYYISTAGQFYALQPDLLAPQALSPVKDAGLLKALQGE